MGNLLHMLLTCTVSQYMFFKPYITVHILYYITHTCMTKGTSYIEYRILGNFVIDGYRLVSFAETEDAVSGIFPSG